MVYKIYASQDFISGELREFILYRLDTPLQWSPLLEARVSILSGRGTANSFSSAVWRVISRHLSRRLDLCLKDPSSISAASSANLCSFHLGSTNVMQRKKQNKWNTPVLWACPDVAPYQGILCLHISSPASVYHHPSTTTTIIIIIIMIKIIMIIIIHHLNFI